MRRSLSFTRKRTKEKESVEKETKEAAQGAGSPVKRSASFGRRGRKAPVAKDATAGDAEAPADPPVATRRTLSFGRVPKNTGLPPGWKRVMVEGKQYFFNELTKEMTTTRPKGEETESAAASHQDGASRMDERRGSATVQARASTTVLPCAPLQDAAPTSF
jgi:hypothetical protein